MSKSFKQQEIPVADSLDVQAVEAALNNLWREEAGAHCAALDETDGDAALMRARVLNLLAYVTSAADVEEVNRILSEVTVGHPCRALVMVADKSALEERDIEMFVSAVCHARGEGSGGRRVCCEQVTLRASGRYAVELPSAATPLLISDLPVFLYWRDSLAPARSTDATIFQSLAEAADRLVLDSAEFANPLTDLVFLVQLTARSRSLDLALSDLNWSRLTSWRALLASFYDVQEYRPALELVSRASIEYVAPIHAPEEIAPQALMLAGWLAGRLGWQLLPDKLDQEPDRQKRSLLFEKDGRRIQLELRRVSRPEMKQGRLARVELCAEAETGSSSFVVRRSEDGLYLETQVARGEEVRAARVLKVRNRSAAVLLGRELEIVGHDTVYEEALRLAATLSRV